MDIILSKSSDKPIYEQISSQIKSQVLSSIRALADGLGVSVITTKRAYADLEADGLIETVQGKGCFVSEKNRELLREERQKHVEALLSRACVEAMDVGLTRRELHDLLDLMAPESLG